MIADVTASKVAPLALLLGFAVGFGGAALGTTPLAFDDHPGQLYRVWHVVTHGFAPWRWNDGWWTGYPELQFYPPAFAYAGAALHALSFGQLPVGGAYHALVWLAWLAPGVTTWALVTRVAGNGWLALPAGFVALTLSGDLASGVEGGVHIGMAPARLGWALLPLLALALMRGAGRPRASIAGAVVLAALVLTHPAHVPTALALTALHAATRETGRGAHALAALRTATLALALIAFWSVPLVARLAETRALAWARLTPADLAGSLVRHPLLAALVLLAALAPWLARRPDERMLAWLPWVAGALVVADAAVLEPVGIRWLPAHRIVDGAWLAAVVAAGFTAARGVQRVAPAADGRRALASLAVLAAAVLLSLPGGTLALWPRGAEWPALRATTRGLRLDDLWHTLRRAPPGRVLFVRSAVPLVYGTDWWRPHTHVTALAPLETGRGIVNGTFTHPSPVAALVYRGDAGPGAITALVETLDGRSLFGQPLASLDRATFAAYAERLGISTIVALDEDAPRLPSLGDGPGFTRLASTPPFVVWARANVASPPERLARDVWRVRPPGDAEQWVSAGLGYYPLWRAREGSRPLETRRGPLGDLEIRLSRRDADVELVYAPGVPEIGGAIVSAVAVLAATVLAWRRR
jgi:hypothetical protein